MPILDYIMPRLFALAKKNFLIKRLGRPLYSFLARMRVELSLIGKKRMRYPQVSNFIASTKEWADQKTDAPFSPEYISLDKAEMITRNLPHTIDGPMHWKFGQNLEHQLPETFLLKLPMGRSVFQGFVVNQENVLLGEVSKMISRSDFVDDYEKHPVLHTKLPPIESIKGRVAVLSISFAGTNYYHWLLDLLPRLALIEKGGESLDSIDYFLVNDRASRFQRESLEHLGIPKQKIMESHWHPHIQATELIVPSFPCDTGHFSRWQVDWLQEKFRSENAAKPFRRLYLNRRKVSYRKVENESDIENLLYQYGFESIDPADYSIQEQVRLFSEAEILIAPHGAALANIVFCQPGTKVVELIHPKAVNLMFWTLSETIGLDYHYFLAEGDRPTPGEDPYENFIEMRFSLETLFNMLEYLNLSPE